LENMKNTAQLELFAAAPRGPFHAPPGGWARRGLVDAGFVERSVAAMRDLPDAERRLRDDMEESLQSIRDIDLVYGNEPNEWATATRERLWLEHFTAEAILRRLKSEKKCQAAKPAAAAGSDFADGAM
jgi:hypothetical protein